MVTCNHCGSELVIEAGRCTACGEETAVAERRETLRVEAARLDEVPREAGAPVPGGWGRSDDDAAEVRHLRPTPDTASVEQALTDAAHASLDSPGGPASDPTAQAESEPTAATSSGVDSAGAPDPDRVTPDPGTPRPRAAAPAPPLLASELLQRELAPAQPREAFSRALATLAALAGAAAVASVVGVEGAGGGLLAAFVGLGTMALAPMPYGIRAAGLALIGSGGFTATLWARSADGARDEVLPAMLVILTAAALFFRAWHRGSALARILVGLGIALGVSWLAMGAGMAELSQVEVHWQSWGPQVLKLLLAVLLLLSLLAFMDARSTGGAEAWAAGLLLWYGADVAIKGFVRLQSEAAPALPPTVGLAYLLAAPMAAVLAVSLAQLLSVAQAAPEDAAG